VNEERKFQIGDVVRMIGPVSNPRMTVSHYNASRDVVCKWFINYELRREAFAEDTLQRVVQS